MLIVMEYLSKVIVKSREVAFYAIMAVISTHCCLKGKKYLCNSKKNPLLFNPKENILRIGF